MAIIKNDGDYFTVLGSRLYSYLCNFVKSGAAVEINHQVFKVAKDQINQVIDCLENFGVDVIKPVKYEKISVGNLKFAPGINPRVSAAIERIFKK